MDTKKRASLTIIGGVLCSVLASVLGGVVIVVIRLVKVGSAEGAAPFLPIAVLYAAATAAPFGLIAGSAGTWWLAARAERHMANRQLWWESAGAGALLGATYPVVMGICGWGPFSNLVSELPIAVGIGMTCALVVAFWMQRHVLASN
jgi:hypothetical protein